MENLTENISSKIAFYLCDTKDESSDEFEILKYGVCIGIATKKIRKGI